MSPRSTTTAMPAQARSPVVGDRQIAAYSVAAMSAMFLNQPVISYVPQLYAKELGIGLAGLGAVLFVGRILNAVIDQLVGYLSDRTRTRWGARKPWIVGGSTLLLLAAFFLLRPPAGIGLLYFFVWRLIYDFANAMVNVSYNAWGAELSDDYHRRARIVAFRGGASQVGHFLADLLPILVALAGLTATSAYSMTMMGYIFLVGLVLVPITAWTAVSGAPQGTALPPERPNIRGMLSSVRTNRPFWLYLASFGLTGIGLGVLQLMFTFYDGYLKLGAWFPYIMTAYSVATIAGIPFWTWLASRIGKHKAYSISMLLASTAMNGFWFVTPGVTPMSTLLPMAFAVLITMGFGVAGSMALPAAILADVVDYGTLKTGEVRTGSYFAFYMLTTTIAMAIGAALGFMLLAAFGYDARVGATNGAFARWGILITVIAIPTAIKITGSMLVWNFPIDVRRHAIIRRRIAARGLRGAHRDVPAVAPQTIADAETLSGRAVGVV